MDTEYTEKTYGVDRFLLEGWFSVEEIEKLLVEMKGRVITPSLPVQRPWVGLTEEEAIELLPVGDWEIESTLEFAKAIETKLKEKNT
jgi:hypothetical protein